MRPRDWKNYKSNTRKLPWREWELTARRTAKMTVFIPDGGASYATSVRDRLLSIADWVRLHQHVTEEQAKAISNIEEGVLEWLAPLDAKSWQPEVEQWERDYLGDRGETPEEGTGEEWWEVLGCHPSASSTEVRDAYRVAAKKAHPDKEGGSEDAMKKVNAAWEAYQKIFAT